MSTETITSLLGYGLLALIPVFLWLYWFRNHLPKKRSYIVTTFVAGMVSVLPIKLYEKYWDQAILSLEHTNLFKHLVSLLELQSVGSLGIYAVATVLVMCAIFLFTGLVMGILEIFSGDNSFKVFRQKFRLALESPFFFVTVGVFCGCIAFMSTLSLHEKIWMFMVVGMLEEFTKHLVLRFSDEEKIHSVGEALQFSIIVALGFAFVENVIYFNSMGNMGMFSVQQLVLLIVLRSIISVGAHVCFSAILGYYYGLAKFSTQVYQEEEFLHKNHFLIKTLNQVLHCKPSVLFHEQKMMEGVILAMFLHGAFNSLLEFGKLHIVFPFIGILLLTVFYLVHKQEELRITGALIRKPEGV